MVLLFSAWQHFELLRHGYRLEQMQRERAAEALKLTAQDLLRLKLIDEVIPEPLGGVHQDKTGKWQKKALEAEAQGVKP